jgi:hypothetical protein
MDSDLSHVAVQVVSQHFNHIGPNHKESMYIFNLGPHKETLPGTAQKAGICLSINQFLNELGNFEPLLRFSDTVSKWSWPLCPMLNRRF